MSQRNTYNRFLLRALVAIGALLMTGAYALAARPGTPSKGFGGDGIVTLGSDARLLDVAPAPRGRIVVVGVTGAGARHARLLVERLTRRGRRDPSFRGGKPFLGPSGTVANAVTVRRDGSIVVAGTIAGITGGGQEGMFALRLKPNGRKDRSFGGDGQVSAFTKSHGQGLGLAVYGDGRVLVCGTSIPLDFRDGFDRVGLARFKANGRRDRSFARNGRAVIDLGRYSVADDVAVTRAGKIVIAGSQRDNLQSTVALAARLRPNGALDRSFAGSGAFLHQYARGAAYSAFRSLALRRGGRIVLTGSSTSAANGAEALVVQLNSRGRPDGRFGAGGAVRLAAAKNRNQFGGSPVPGGFGVGLSGGDIVIAGSYDSQGLKNFAFWALHGGGGLDRGFGKGGRALRGVQNKDAGLYGLAVAGGHLAAAGSQVDLFSNASNGIAARYEGP